VGAEKAQELSEPAAAELRELAGRLARAAAEVLRSRPADLGVTTKSGPTDVVTVMDRAAERIILDGLAAARPHDTVVSEESPTRLGEGGVRWLVDPLDGTVNYLYQLPQYSVSIAAEVDGALVAGVVFDVARDVEYAATAGGGATCNGRAISCGTNIDLSRALVATGFSYDARRRALQARTLATVLPAVRDIRRLGSAALDLCAVASGQVDAYFEAGMHEWDWAAGTLIAREAGAQVEGLGGRPPGSATTVAANPALFNQLHDLLVAANADESVETAERQQADEQPA
jgi:myo-inositol-1(or 4)-monophosphatase